jgi:hypothetical protein
MRTHPENNVTVGLFETLTDPFIRDVYTRLKYAGTDVEYLVVKPTSWPLEPCWRVVVDRLGFRFPYIHELVKSLSLRGVYVLNNPYSGGVVNKLIEADVCSALSIPVPATVTLPRMVGYDETEGAVDPIDWDIVASTISFPCVVKPHDGYAWDDVCFASDIETVKDIYSRLGHRSVLMAQTQVRYTDYYRAYCIGQRDVKFIRWIPRPMGMGEFLDGDGGLTGVLRDQLASLTVRLNQALDFDINGVEWCLDPDGRPWLIDAFNEVPEILPDHMPADAYEWIVSRFTDCIISRAKHDTVNRKPILLQKWT